MNRSFLVALTLATAAIAVTVRLGAHRAHAQDEAPTIDGDPTPPDGDGPGPAPVPETAGPRLVCQVFLTDLRDPPPIDTADGTTEIGQWVQARADEGLVLYGVDFEVGQKATGYPQGYVQVCVYPG